MTAAELVNVVEGAGGVFIVEGDRLRCTLPQEAAALVPELRAQKPQILRVLRRRRAPWDVCPVHGDAAQFWERRQGGWVCPVYHPGPHASRRVLKTPPAIPTGVHLVSWEPVLPPVVLTSYSVVMDVERFIDSTLQQLAAALQGQHWQAGNWATRDLVERLEQIGIVVEVERSVGGQ